MTFFVKKITAWLLLAALLAALLTGCIGRSESPEESTGETSLDESPASTSVPEYSGTVTSSQAASLNAAINQSDVHIIQFNDPDPGDKIAVITTSEGEIRVRLFAEQAPKTVEAFVTLAEAGSFNGQSFTTAINGFKIEGGGAGNKDKFPAEPEYSLDLWNFRGAVALADNGSDFTIVQASRCLNKEEDLKAIHFPQKVIDKYLEVGGAPHQDWRNPVFGAVIDGMDVVDKIAGTTVDENNKPLETVVISTIAIEEE